MKKVFCIICHKVSAPLKMTVNYLSSFEDNHIIIHVDKKSDIEPFNALESENVIILTDRVEIHWGGVSQIEATISLLKKSIDIGFDYLFLLSGDDLPCVTNEHIDTFLYENNLTNLVHYQDARNNYVDPTDRVKYKYPSFFFSNEKRLLTKITTKLFKVVKPLFINKLYSEAISNGVIFHKGTNWFALNRETVDKTISFVDTNAWFLALFKDSFCGDEVFFHTLFKFIGISDFYHDPSKKNDALRYIDWESGSQYPRVLDSSDLHKIKSSQCLFARKFSHDIDDLTLLKLIGPTPGLKLPEKYG